MSDFDNQEEERGFIEQLNVGDTFLTCWECLWLIPITMVLILVIRSITKHTTYAKKTWILGLIVSICLYLRHLSSITSWVS